MMHNPGVMNYTVVILDEKLSWMKHVEQQSVELTLPSGYLIELLLTLWVLNLKMCSGFS
jgi:hypothetical protein